MLSHSQPIQIVTFTHMPNRYFNTSSYSRQLWDTICYEAQHYFSVSEHTTPDISRDLLAADQAEEQLNTLDRYIQENAQVFQSMHTQVQKQFKPMHCRICDTLMKLVHLNVTCIWHFNLWHWLQDLWHHAILLQVLIITVKLLLAYCRSREKKVLKENTWKIHTTDHGLLLPLPSD
jgi:hypothetical protein